MYDMNLSSYLYILGADTQRSHMMDVPASSQPGRLVVAATSPGIPMMTGWFSREPTIRSKCVPEVRTVMTQSQFSNMFCLDYNDETIEKCLAFVRSTPL